MQLQAINGSRAATAAVATASVVLDVLDDAAPELDELCTVEFGVLGADWLQLGERAIVAVALESDDPGGVVHLISPGDSGSAGGDQASSLFVVTDMDNRQSTVVVQVFRDAGTVGDALVAYELRYAAPANSVFAGSELLQTWETQGVARIEAGAASARVEVLLPANVRLEINGLLELEIANVELEVDGELRATLSAFSESASIRVDESRRLVASMVAENALAHGRVSIASELYTVEEQQGGNVVTVGVVRDIASAGEVQVLWQAAEKPGSSIAGEAREGADFSQQAGSVVLASGVFQAYFQVSVLDDALPEASEAFAVELVQVLGGGVLGDVTASTVVIPANDGAAGTFSFSNASTALVVQEPSSSSASTSTMGLFEIVRQGGTLGSVDVVWQVEALQPPSAATSDVDVYPQQGVVTFAPGQTTGMVALGIQADDEPELAEEFAVSITRLDADIANQAFVNDVARARVLLVPANDFPYGILQVSTASQQLQVATGTLRYARIAIGRGAGGAFEQVQVQVVVQLNADGIEQEQEQSSSLPTCETK